MYVNVKSVMEVATKDLTNGSEQDSVLEAQKLVWIQKQNDVRSRIITEDCECWQKNNQESTLSREQKSQESHSSFPDLKYVGGLDISFIKGDLVNAYVALVVVSFPDLQTVHQDCQPVKITQPYIPGFLAFREIDHFIYILQKLKQDKPDHFPQVIFIDGNGLLHPRECGIACQLGVETGCVTVGCAKNLYMMDSITRDAKHKTQIEGLLRKAGDYFELRRDQRGSKVLGAALKTVQNSSKPIYVSVGHRISLATACSLVTKCSLFRQPEPIRRADHLSRDIIRSLVSLDGKKSASDDTSAGHLGETSENSSL